MPNLFAAFHPDRLRLVERTIPTDDKLSLAAMFLQAGTPAAPPRPAADKPLPAVSSGSGSATTGIVRRDHH